MISKGKIFWKHKKKYYLSDLGFRHAKLGYQSNNISGYLENIVFLELLRRKYKVNIGKQDNKEIDFVANLRDENLYLQVTYLLASLETIEREFSPLKSIKIIILKWSFLWIIYLKAI